MGRVHLKDAVRTQNNRYLSSYLFDRWCVIVGGKGGELTLLTLNKFQSYDFALPDIKIFYNT